MTPQPGPASRAAHVVHHVPGRLRIRIDGARNEVALFEQVRRQLLGLAGVEAVRISPASSSVVIRYVPIDRGFATRLCAPDGLALWLDAIDEAWNAPEPLNAARLPSHSHLARGIVRLSSELDHGVREATAGIVDLKVLLPLALAGLARIAERRQEGTPLWLTLVIFAFNSFMSLHRVSPDAAGALPAEEAQQIRIRTAQAA